jgi:hypothetical protein
MKAKEFIFKNLRDLVNKFPQISFRYQFDELEQTHIVEVSPLSAYVDDPDYKMAEGDLTYEFDRAFLPETIMFVSGNSLTGVTRAEKVFCKEDHFVWEVLQDMLSANETIPEYNYSINESLNSFQVDELHQDEFNYSTDLQETVIESKTSFSQCSNYALAA